MERIVLVKGIGKMLCVSNDASSTCELLSMIFVYGRDTGDKKKHYVRNKNQKLAEEIDLVCSLGVKEEVIWVEWCQKRGLASN